MKQNGKEIELKSTEKKLSKDEKYMHEVFLVLRSMLSYKLVLYGKSHKIYAQHVKNYKSVISKKSYFKHSHTAVVCIVHQILSSNSKKRQR